MLSRNVYHRLFSAHALVIADHSGGALSKSSQQVIEAARKLNGKITVGVFGGDDGVVKQAASIRGVSKVVTVKSQPGQKVFTADVLAVGVCSLAKQLQVTHILSSTSSTMKDALPRVGALMDSQPISDVIDVISDSMFKRPMYAGNVVATVESLDTVKILTVRPTAFPLSDTAPSAPCEIEPTTVDLPPSSIHFQSEEAKSSDKVDLSTASVVISGGRGLKSKENFEALLNPLAAKLKAAVGASRAAVDAGFAANDMQIGQTGKVVAPDLYIAVGISGAIQHVAGMKDSRTIVAINKDKDCAMMQIADYGIVGDLNQIVPELTLKIS